MSTSTKPKAHITDEKEFRKIISGKLDIALKEYRDMIGSRKFVSKIKKASKLFSYDLAKHAKKAAKEDTKKKTVKPSLKK
jgi:hypothetical protein